MTKKQTKKPSQNQKSLRKAAIDTRTLKGERLISPRHARDSLVSLFLGVDVHQPLNGTDSDKWVSDHGTKRVHVNQ